MANFAGQATLRLDTGTQDKAHNHRVQAFTQSDPGDANGVTVSADAPFELAAGATVTLHVVSNQTAGSPDGQDLRVWITVLEDNSSTVALAETLVIDVVSYSGTETGTVNFTPTETGTFRLKLRARYDFGADGAAGGYDADTDGAYSLLGAVNVWAASADEASPGYIRAGVAVTAVDVDNDTAFAGAPVPFAWPDTVRLRATVSHVAVANSSSLVIDADTLNVATPVRDTQINADAVSTTWNDTGGTAQLDGTDPTSFGVQVGTPANSTLSARPWTHFESAPTGWTLGATDGGAQTTESVSMTRDATLDWDGRVTVDHHMQLDDNVFDAALDVTSRLSSNLGFVTFTLLNARDEPVDAVTATETLADDQALVAAAINRSEITGVNGRPPTLATWDSQLPGGGWTHTIDITAPAGVVGQEVTPTAAYTLKAVDPAVEPVIYIGAANVGDTPDHMSAGDDVQIAVTVKDRDTAKRLTPDAGTVRCNVIRWSTVGSRFEFLAADETSWTNWTVGVAAAEFAFVDAGDGITFTKTFTTTADWGAEDIVAVNLIVEIGGTPYGWFVGRELTGGANRHSGQKFDVLDFAGVLPRM